jgi:hypothetical protein
MQCPCDRAFRVKDELAGKKIRCPSCQQVLLVPAPEVEILDEDAAVNYLLTEEPEVKVKSSRKARRDEDDEDNEERITSRPTALAKPMPRRDEEEDRPRRPRRTRLRQREEERSSFLPAISISPTMMTGVSMDDRRLDDGRRRRLVCPGDCAD